MTIDILKTLANLKPNYRGAIFLTYTLDLLFFEELIVPKLDALGCTNVMIVADQHGYDEAIRRGGHHLRRAGRQYVCAPVIRRGQGVQHAKVILLVGQHHGLLLVGSGNLTLHGIGRNLEQFVRFDIELDNDNTDPTLRYPFHTVWQLIGDISQKMELSSTTADRLQAVRELAPWLEEPVDPPPDLRLWHSFDRSILSQWRDRDRLDELRLLSPFWAVNAVDEMVNRFRPRKLILGLNAWDRRIDGPSLQQKSAPWQCDMELFDVMSKLDDSRHLHAKTFTGSNERSSWCITGSANCTVPGLQRSWSSGGNLELVVWQKTESPGAFNEIWSDEVLRTTPLQLEAVEELDDGEPVEIEVPFRLRELKYDHGHLYGKIEYFALASEQSGEWWLDLQRSAEQLLISPDGQGWFSIALGSPLDGIEAGRVIFRILGQADIASPFHWVDQPAELIRFGNRTYHARVQASLQTFAGAGQLFEELLNFLWERVDPRQFQEEDDEDETIRRRRRRKRRQSDDEDPE